MTASAKITAKTGKLEEFLKRVKKEAGRTVVKVGVTADAGGHREAGDGLTVADVASFAEFGTVTEPERSFLRATFEAKKPELKEMSRKLERMVILGTDGMTNEKALGILGEKLQLEVQETIRQGIEPELAEATVAAKGSTTPLIDSGQLIQSIRYKVES